MEKTLSVGIIPDGNRSWSRKNNLPAREGHKKGFQRMRNLLKHIEKNHPEIKTLTVYALSKDNYFKRGEKEKKVLWDIYYEGLKEFLKGKYDFQVRFFGLRVLYPKDFLEMVEKAEEMNIEIEKKINFLLIYNGEDVGSKIDMVIRTANRHSFSGFALPNIAYSELYVLEKFWPEFLPADFDGALKWLKGQKRMFGE